MSKKSEIAATTETVTWPVAKLIPYARNPRKNDEVVDRMVASIREFGFKIPILARSDGEIVDGHLRLKAAQSIGISEVPVILCDEWTEAQVKAFRLQINKSVEWADWDEELLALELQELKDLDFNLDLTGFTSSEIAEMMAAQGQLRADQPDDDDIVPDGESNVIIRLSIPASVWLGKRDEINGVLEKMKKSYLCVVQVNE